MDAGPRRSGWVRIGSGDDVLLAASGQAIDADAAVESHRRFEPIKEGLAPQIVFQVRTG